MQIDLKIFFVIIIFSFSETMARGKPNYDFFGKDDEEEVPRSGDFGRGIGTMQERMNSSRDRTLDTQKRALQSIAQSEEMGNATAEELLEQREKLEKANRQLDEISEMQDTSQRHINNLSSIFGGVRNFFSRKKAESGAAKQTEVAASEGEVSRQHLRSVMATNGSHIDRTADRVDDLRSNSTLSNRTKDARDAEIDSNLALMGDGMSRLKNLASGLGTEIESQNKLLDQMAPKADRVNQRMNNQQKDLNRLLYGKK